jgi:hypothetical protein
MRALLRSLTERLPRGKRGSNMGNVSFSQIVLEIVLKIFWTLPPSVDTAAMQTTAISASSKPYSAREAPSSSRTSLEAVATSLDMDGSPFLRHLKLHG